MKTKNVKSKSWTLIERIAAEPFASLKQLVYIFKHDCWTLEIEKDDLGKISSRD